MLHVAVRQVFGSLPAVSKIYYKDTANDTVKGFDCVHIVGSNDGLELWLGEAKFYSDIGDAVRKACESLQLHADPAYMRSEFTAILNKVDPTAPFAETLHSLLQPETSLDEIFDAVVIPVLLTYDSDAVASFNSVCQEYVTAFEAEVRTHHASFTERNPLENVRVHLFLLPLEEKKTLLDKLHERLRTWQVA